MEVLPTPTNGTGLCAPPSDVVEDEQQLEESEVFVGGEDDESDGDNANEPASASCNNPDGESESRSLTTVVPAPNAEEDGSISAGNRWEDLEAATMAVSLTQDAFSLPFDSMLMSASCETSIISVTSSMDYDMDSNTKMLNSMTDSCGEELQFSIVSSKHGSESDVSRSTEENKLGDVVSKRVSYDTSKISSPDLRNGKTSTPPGKSASSSGKTTPRFADSKPCTCGSNSNPATPRTPRRAQSTSRSATVSSNAKSKFPKEIPVTSHASRADSSHSSSSTKKPPIPRTPSQRSSSARTTPSAAMDSKGEPQPNSTSTPNGTRSKTRSGSSARSRDPSCNQRTPRSASGKDRSTDRSGGAGNSKERKTDPGVAHASSRRRRLRETKDGDSSSQDSRGSSQQENKVAFGRTFSLKDRISPDSALECARSNTLDKYATLPRRKKVPTDGSGAAASRTSREPSITRASLLRFWKTKEDLDNKERQFWFGLGKDSRLMKTATSILSRGAFGRAMPPMPGSKERTLICAEAAVQTMLTLEDVKQAFNRGGTSDSVDGEKHSLGWKPSCSTQSVQTEGTSTTEKDYENRLQRMAEENTRLQTALTKLQDKTAAMDPLQKELARVCHMLEEEQEEKAEVQRELEKTAQRIVAMVESMDGVEKGTSNIQNSDFVSNPKTTKAEISNRSENIQELQNQVKLSNQLISSLQEEANFFRNTCRNLQQDLEKSLSAQKALAHQVQESENESTELQEFLQAEKNMLAEALKDAEYEISSLKEQLGQTESDLTQQRAQCHHLVRLSEQRRHEYLTLQSQMIGEQGRAHNLLLQQGAEVSTAAVALTDLTARIDTLVGQLVTSYNFTEKDLDTPVDNKVTLPAEPTGDSNVRKRLSATTDDLQNPSPKKGSSLIVALHHALKNAASSRTAKGQDEPANGMGSGTANGVKENSSNESEPAVPRLIGSQSLQNLSDAIQRRHEQLDDQQEPPDLDSSGGGFTLNDQIEQLDCLVSKLLKILQLIQLDSDSVVDRLHLDKLLLLQEVYHMKNNTADDATPLSKQIVELQERLWKKNGEEITNDVQKRLSFTLLNAHNEVTRLSDAVHNALETLHNIPNVVAMCLPLSKLQLQLEKLTSNKTCNGKLAVEGSATNGHTSSPEEANGK